MSSENFLFYLLLFFSALLGGCFALPKEKRPHKILLIILVSCIILFFLSFLFIKAEKNQRYLYQGTLEDFKREWTLKSPEKEILIEQKNRYSSKISVKNYFTYDFIRNHDSNISVQSFESGKVTSAIQLHSGTITNKNDFQSFEESIYTLISITSPQLTQSDKKNILNQMSFYQSYPDFGSERHLKVGKVIYSYGRAWLTPDRIDLYFSIYPEIQ